MGQAKDKEMEEMRLSYESRRKSQMDREVREMTLKFNAQKAGFEAETKRLREVIELRAREIEDWNVQYSELEARFSQLRSLESKSQQQDNRIVLLEQEIERLNGALKVKMEEISDWKSRYVNLEITVENNAHLQSRIRNLEQTVEALVSNLDQSKLSYGKLE